MWILASRGAPGSFPAAREGCQEKFTLLWTPAFGADPKLVAAPSSSVQAVQGEGSGWGVGDTRPQVPTPVSPSPVPTQVPREELGSGFTSPACWVLISHRAFAKSGCCLAAAQGAPALAQRGAGPTPGLVPCGVGLRGPAAGRLLRGAWGCLQKKLFVLKVPRGLHRSLLPALRVFVCPFFFLISSCAQPQQVPVAVLEPILESWSSASAAGCPLRRSRSTGRLLEGAARSCCGPLPSWMAARGVRYCRNGLGLWMELQAPACGLRTGPHGSEAGLVPGRARGLSPKGVRTERCFRARGKPFWRRGWRSRRRELPFPLCMHLALTPKAPVAQLSWAITQR